MWGKNGTVGVEKRPDMQGAENTEIEQFDEFQTAYSLIVRHRLPPTPFSAFLPRMILVCHLLFLNILCSQNLETANATQPSVLTSLFSESLEVTHKSLQSAHCDVA
jgi:hypothetical protein